MLNDPCAVPDAFLHRIHRTDGVDEAEWTICDDWPDWMKNQFSHSLELDGSFLSRPLWGPPEQNRWRGRPGEQGAPPESSEDLCGVKASPRVERREHFRYLQAGPVPTREVTQDSARTTARVDGPRELQPGRQLSVSSKLPVHTNLRRKPAFLTIVV